MRIWVDADACPKAVKEILFRAVERVGGSLVLVANKGLWVPNSPHIETIRVGAGLDVADARILEGLEPGDLVITADIPLAAEVIDRGGYVITPRGERYEEDTVRERLAMRNFMDELRGSGVLTGGPASFGRRERQAFADQLDRFLARHCKR